MSHSSNSDTFAIVLVVLGSIGAITLAGWGIRACVITEKATLGALDQEVERRNFERSQSYYEGLRRDCAELMLAYERAKSDDERAVILATLRHRVAGAPPEAIPDDVKDFLNKHNK